MKDITKSVKRLERYIKSSLRILNKVALNMAHSNQNSKCLHRTVYAHHIKAIQNFSGCLRSTEIGIQIL
jgi:hypothetical protein